MPLNLEYLIPEKFRTSEIISALHTELDVLISEWIADIAGLGNLLNPETVSADYMQYLADLLGNALSSADTTSEAERRRELIQTVDWIKLKGTYESLAVIGLMLNMSFEVLSMYTNDYSTFVLRDWFVGLTEDANPPGLDSTYYNSPHFGIQIRLNIKYPATATWLYDYLWIPDMFQNLDEYVDKTRPIHTVPHYYVLMEPTCDDDGVTEVVAGDIYTQIIGEWIATKVYFDQDAALGSGQGWNFDDGVYFDTSQDAFYSGITKWVLGTGNKGASPGDSGWSDIETPILEGVVDSVTIYRDRVVWEFILPAQSQNGISELGLYTPGTPDVLRLVSLFPDINLGGNVDLRIVVTVDRIT
jgi:hypothetical protein